ncbi:MAG: phage major capsid protein [Acidimicrobiales bacterium]
MTKDENLVALREKIETDRETAYEAALQLAGTRAGDYLDDGELEWALERCEQLDKRLEVLPKISRIVEPDIYAPGSEHSFLRDLALVAAHGGFAQPAATERLNRHQDHGAHTRQFRQVERRITAEAGGVQFPATEKNRGIPQDRALSLTPTAGVEFSPPDWMLDSFASIARSASPVLRAVPSLPLPDRVFDVIIPRVTSAGGVVVQGAENTTAEETWDTTDSITLPIATFAGQIPMSLQLWERGPNIDRYIIRDFGEAMAASAEQQLLVGTGTAGQLLGLTNVSSATVDGVPGSQVVTYTDATPTNAKIIAAIGETAAAVSNTRLRPPSVAIMTGERYFNLTAAPDGSGFIASQRPGTGLVPTNADLGEYGPIAGLPCLLSGEVPQDLGTGENQDTVIVVRTADLLWMQSDPVFTCYVDASGGPAQLTVYASWHAYGAFACTRYPSAIGTLTGTGMARNALTW